MQNKDKNKTRIAILQQLIPHYREEFYEMLQKRYEITLFPWLSDSQAAKNGFHNSNLEQVKLRGLAIGTAVIYDPFCFLLGKYDIVVLEQEMKYLSHWFLLLFARIFRKKVVLWGHGITVTKYIDFEKKMPLSRKIMFQLCDGAWFYTKKEQGIWHKILPKLKSVALGNTISRVSDILAVNLTDRIGQFKGKYNIITDVNFIICTRFSYAHRRMELFVELIKKLDSKHYGFIVIGDGDQKPSFRPYSNVYDFGAVYDKEKKDELFTIADIYFQPAFTGLSIVEAMAYAKPVFTLRRSVEFIQEVEYGYIEHGSNGMIFDTIAELHQYIDSVAMGEIHQMGLRAREYVKNNLTMESMVSNASKGIELFLDK